MYFLGCLLSVGMGTVVKAASFDCNKAATETEIAICSDPELNALDELMEAWWKTKKIQQFLLNRLYPSNVLCLSLGQNTTQE